MPKNIIQDIKIKRPPKREYLQEAEPREYERREHGETVKKKKNRPRYRLWLVAIVSLIFFFFAISYMFLKVEVTVDPKMAEVALNENLSASKDGTGEELPFD